MLYVSYYDSPIGKITLGAREDVLVGAWFEGQKYFGNTLPDKHIPQETEILGVEVSDDVCYVDFSSAFSDSGIDIPVNTMIYSVVNSLLDTASADKVQISVEGDTEATLSDGTSLYSLFSKNTDLVLKEDQSE